MTEETLERLTEIPNLQVLKGASLARYTRFGIGGPADLLAETQNIEALGAAIEAARESGMPLLVIGGGTNLIVSDEGFRGLVLRCTAKGLRFEDAHIVADAGADLDELVDFAVGHNLQGIETLKRIPGFVGGAVYGNAGAYGHSISERISRVRFVDGSELRCFTKPECSFSYRESIFKRHKEWVIISVEFALEPGDPEELKQTVSTIQATRDRKFPPTMKCAGSIFKNLLAADLSPELFEHIPPRVIREGKVPAAYFLEEVGAKGMMRGDIRVTDYHANVIYNADAGTARDLVDLIRELKARVNDRFGLILEEEVQYVGFD